MEKIRIDCSNIKFVFSPAIKDKTIFILNILYFYKVIYTFISREQQRRVVEILTGSRQTTNVTKTIE